MRCMRAAAPKSRGEPHNCDFRVFDQTFHTSFKPHIIYVLTIESRADNSGIIMIVPYVLGNNA